MASYRFCRSDDVPLLVRAYNECFHPNGRTEPVDREGFKWWIRVLELWTSSCMVATEGERLIGVLLAAKREAENCILAVGVHPDFRRLDHGRHMVTSLSQKLAILGPPRILAEVPAANVCFCAFLEHCGFDGDTDFVDYSMQPPFVASKVPSQMVAEIDLDELAGAGFPETPATLCWGRTADSIARRREYFDSIRVLALAGVDRFEAALVVDEKDSAERRILAVHAADNRKQGLAGALLRHYASLDDRPVTWERVHASECTEQRAKAWGLSGGETTRRFAITAIPA